MSVMNDHFTQEEQAIACSGESGAEIWNLYLYSNSIRASKETNPVHVHSEDENSNQILAFDIFLKWSHHEDGDFSYARAINFAKKPKVGPSSS